MKKFVALITLMIGVDAFAERFGGINNPMNFNSLTGARMVTRFLEIPLTGKLNDSRLAWSETYWPSNKGGIAYRWNDPHSTPFKNKLYTLNELKNLNETELSYLSPAELYDISQGDYNYTLTRRVLSKVTPRDLWWEGICHGWAQAASNYPEPAKISLTNRDGIRITFGSSDVKALLAMHDAYNSSGTYARVGERCDVRGKVPGEEDPRDGRLPIPTEDEMNNEKCRDVNAGAFHLVLTNMIGIHSRSFVADIDRLNDVWNQPIYSYESSIIGEEPVGGDDRANGVQRRVRVAMKMTYGEELQFESPERVARGEINFVSKEPVTGTPHQAFKSKSYEYILEIDGLGHIVGGEWISGTRPDFLWGKRRDVRFLNYPIPLAGLNAIYRPVKR